MPARKKFCPKCGRATESFYDGLCGECFLSKLPIPKFPKKIPMKRCKHCGKFFVGNKIFYSLEDAAESALMKILERPEIKRATYKVKGNKVDVEFTLSVKDLEKTEERAFDLVEKPITCQFCSMQRTRYYNAILQIRASERVVDEMLVAVENRIASMRERDNLAFISNIEKKRRGVDVYVGSKSAAGHIAKSLKNKFKAEVKITRKLVGMKKGKRVYRSTILVKAGER